MKTVNPERVEEIRNVLVSGVNTLEAAEILKLSQSSIERWKHRLGLTKKVPGKHPSHVCERQAIEMRRLYGEGRAYSTIGKWMGFSEATVRKHIESAAKLEDDPINRLLMSPMSRWGQVFVNSTNNINKGAA